MQGQIRFAEAAAEIQFGVEPTQGIAQPCGVSKQVLGRGLNHLLEGGKPSGRTVVPSASDSARLQALPERGVKSLLNGVENVTFGTPPGPQKEFIRQTAVSLVPLPKWPFFVADAFLLSFVAVLVWTSARPLSKGVLAICALGVVAGAVIALLPFWLENRRRVAVQPTNKSAVRLRISLQ